ncbi:sulfatase-like hydrolase/transferase, partial [Klebsiella pneumoniae]|uniref:sulfatase-like hydrolase/transferase n=1 Tax=Klebsiella pneumoniae TaxID=573 RepID=UPI00132F9BB1
LRNSGSTFSLVYFSDHGLAFKERGKDVQYLAHDDKYQQNFQVPFMVISSDDKAHRVIKARRSANDFLGFFSQWTGIKAKEINIKYPFISEKKAGSIYITNFQLQKVD